MSRKKNARYEEEEKFTAKKVYPDPVLFQYTLEFDACPAMERNKQSTTRGYGSQPTSYPFASNQISGRYE